MDNINSESMKIDCKNAVLQIQYFIARDFKLDPQLFEACHSDAVRVCHAKPAWHDDANSMDPERGPLVLPCLYRYLYNANGQTVRSDALQRIIDEGTKRVIEFYCAFS